MSSQEELNERIFEQAAGAVDYLQELEEQYPSNWGQIGKQLEKYFHVLVEDVRLMEDDPNMKMAEEVGEAVLSACADILAHPGLDHSWHIESIILLRQMMCPGVDLTVWTDWPWDVTEIWDELAEE